MTQSTTERTGAEPAGGQPGSLHPQGRGVLADRAFWLVSLTAGVLVLAILALILLTTVREAWPALKESGWGFLSSDVWIANDPDGDGPLGPQFGVLAFIYGTLVVSLISLAIAVPVSIGIGLFLTELAPRRLRTGVVTVIDLLAAIPSVVFGLWGILVVAPALVPVYRWVHESFGRVPLLGSLVGEPVSSGRNFLTAGLILAIMIIPIITSITREVFATVPQADKQAAYALGATRWEMIKGAVLPHSFGGVVGAVMLGLGRAMGETIAVALTIGAATQIVPNLFASGNALPAVIVQQWGESGGIHTAALVGCGTVLFAITIVINYAARIIVRRAEIRMKGAAT
ncbi:MAG TPA: phosphate ABC transporter permease subunit PstC [Micromonosporaceae bacterium]